MENKLKRSVSSSSSYGENPKKKQKSTGRSNKEWKKATRPVVVHITNFYNAIDQQKLVEFLKKNYRIMFKNELDIVNCCVRRNYMDAFIECKTNYVCRLLLHVVKKLQLTGKVSSTMHMPSSDDKCLTVKKKTGKIEPQNKDSTKTELQIYKVESNNKKQGQDKEEFQNNEGICVKQDGYLTPKQNDNEVHSNANLIAEGKRMLLKKGLKIVKVEDYEKIKHQNFDVMKSNEKLQLDRETLKDEYYKLNVKHQKLKYMYEQMTKELHRAKAINVVLSKIIN